MKRTGSSGSRVPPALTTNAAPRDRAASPGPAVRGTRSTMTAGSASRPSPESPPASRPLSGGTISTPRRSRVARFSRTDGVLPHLGVHGRADDHRCPGGEQRGASTGRRRARRHSERGCGRWPAPPPRGRRSGRASCGGWATTRPTASAGPARTPGPRTSPRRRTAWRLRSAPASRARRHRRGAGRPRPPCRRRCHRTRRGRRGAAGVRSACTGVLGSRRLRPSAVTAVPLRRRLARGRVVVPDVERFDHSAPLAAASPSPSRPASAASAMAAASAASSSGSGRV